MGYSFSIRDKTASKSVRRIAHELFLRSLEDHRDQKQPRAERVHELRKNVKKARALLRLVRPAFDDFARENAALRDAARLIAPLRDVDVLLTTFDKVASQVSVPPEPLEALRARIAAARDGSPDAEALLAAHTAAIADINRRARRWKISGSDFDALAPGLERSWAAARKTMQHALASPSPEALHNWRKRVKDHWYHARLLAPVWPEMMSTHVALAETLGETLGDARDLAALADALAADTGGQEIRSEALRQEDALLADARALGTRFFGEPASGLARRWRTWWDIWRDA